MDIRNFFSRKRKHSDDNEEGDNPVKKKRKLTTQTIQENKKQKEEENKEESTNTNTKNDVIPSIESLEINKEHDEEKCESESESEDDDYITNEENTNNSNKNTNNTKQRIPSIALSKTKESSLKESFKYDIINECGFKSNNKIEYIIIANLFDKISSTTKRLEKIELISRLFRSILLINGNCENQKECEINLLYSLYLCCNELGPPYKNIELGIGDSIILKALCESTGRKLRDLKQEYIREGDLGLVAVNCRSKQNTLFKPKPLTINLIFETFKKIATISGSGTQQEKVRLIQKLIVASKSIESKYIVRHLQGKLRIGVNEQTVLSALGRALAFHELKIYNNKNKKKIKNYEKISELENKYTYLIKQAVSQLPNYEKIIYSLIKYGINNLNKYCHLTPGIPIKAMLAKPTKGISEILKRFENLKFTLEYKYDGERAQIHLLPDGSIKIFSRNAENNTVKFPELTNTEFINKICNKNKNIKSFIIDSEIVAYDTINDTILPFSTLITRKKKHVNINEISVSICIYAFDCLLINGKPLIQKSFEERRKYLYESFNEIRGEFFFAHHKDTTDNEEILEFLNESVTIGKCEGLMIKTLNIDSTYEPSKRSHNWLKCKKDYLDGVGDTLDLVVMGAFHGTGKRVGKYGSYLVGCYNDDEDTYQSTCKVATGFTDDDLQRLDTQMNKFKTKNNIKPIEYETSYECQVWFEPKIVLELKCADLTISPTHSAASGLAHESKGIALRFPRYIRNRDDKDSMSATNAQQIYEMYANQAILN